MASGRIGDDRTWQTGRWRHIAAVWDAGAERKDWLRLYVDGKRVSGPLAMEGEDRLGADKSVRVELDSGFYAQMGSLNSGRYPAQAEMKELRISRTARYRDDFSPVHGETKSDKDTCALFHLKGSLRGEGMTPEGQRYTVEATAGVVNRY